ncbi:MAG: DUF389 domain-containing protein [Cryomorphaceae bacterium]|nr:DUF389 domain-containing protein [Cryomorphaceae bacterium]
MSEKKFGFIPKVLWEKLTLSMHNLFDLSEDKDDAKMVMAAIERSVEFRGTNLWILIFAILVCSLGLNVNSTAVIIGAMLISPLLGPIMGLGLGVATYNFELVKKAFKNFGIAVGISVLASAFYFLISPLSEAQSELLARTTPNIYDVFVALFGGLAGIIAFTRKDKNSTVIPGVAIATALMPPLCTAGYGLATLQFSYFFGAFYLFFINSVFISLASFLILRFLKFPVKTFVNPQRAKQVRQTIIFLVTITVLPSIYLGVGIIKRSYFESNANAFLNKEMDFPSAQIVTKEINYDSKNPVIKVTYVGAFIDNEMIEFAKSKLGQYRLENVQLLVRQGLKQDQFNPESIKSGVLEDLVIRSEREIEKLKAELERKEQEISVMGHEMKISRDVQQEVTSMYPAIKRFGLSKSLVYEQNVTTPDTIFLVRIDLLEEMSEREKERLKSFLTARLKRHEVELVFKPLYRPNPSREWDQQ